MDKPCRWKAMTRVAHSFMNAGLTLFGSYVSTQIIHDDHACKFYELKTFDHDLVYADATCHPELSGRFLIPQDIDVICNRDQFEKSMEQFKRFYYIRYVRKLDMSYMHWMCPFGEYHLFTTEFVTFIDGKYIMVPVDFVVQSTEGPLELPNKVDSDVNGLLLTSNGLKIHRSVRDFYNRRHGCDLSTLMKVIKNVLNRECIARITIERDQGEFELLPERRMQKLLSKGYTVRVQYAELHFIRATDPYEGECVICLQPCTGVKCKLARCDCNLRFCADCISRAIDKVTTCPLCRNDLDTASAKLDIASFEKHGIFSRASDYLKLVKN